MPRGDNLVAGKLTSKQAAELGKKGGAASGAARRRKKELSQSLSMLLKMNVYDEKAKEELRAAGFEDENLINLSYLGYSIFKKALDGDVEAFREIRKLSEETEKEKQETEKRNADLADRAERAQQLMEQYAESMNLHNCDDCEKLSDIRQKVMELTHTLESEDEQKIRAAAKRLVEYLEV